MKRYLHILALALLLLLAACTPDNANNTVPPTAGQTAPLSAETVSPTATASPESTGNILTAESKPDEYGSSAELGIGYDGDTITTVIWKEYSNGQLKDENYGRDLGEQQFKKAQDALKGSATYPKQLLDKQDIDKVDAVSGATTSYESFKALYEEVKSKKQD